MKQLRNIRFRLILVTLILLKTGVWAQQNSTYNMDFVKSVQFTTDNQNHILVILKVIPTIKDFKLILSMKVTYEIDQRSKVVNLQKQSEGNIGIILYGADLQNKNSKLYNLIKDSVNFSSSEDMRLIVFDFHNITKTQVNNMSVVYGLWEGINEDIRNEKTFKFKVEKID